MSDPLMIGNLRPFEFRPMREDPANPGALLPAEIDGASVVVASADETIIRIINLVATNTLISGQINPITLTAEGAPSTRYTISADADMGPNVFQVTGFGEVPAVVANPNMMATTFALTELPDVPKD